ncbi:hypothetical protein [Bradyrhizobium prioriisuperbiae]|uniref:hypothetical protein n=1 Tax=Bradyrhizobium prioriisuperbiae TaxID=2854389 RepID=UPI0028ED0AF7|nr:hypothetical protein [Bradyrhizobium prioritasuperba]
MANIVIYRPGTSTIYESQSGGASGVEWRFMASVDGRRGLISAVFPFGTSEEAAAGGCRKILVARPDELEGII